ncbi:MAG: OmpA family protein [Bacteroidales bacterium]|nr:OmpA family protein [Candidatus Liminaster caballi]
MRRLLIILAVICCTCTAGVAQTYERLSDHEQSLFGKKVFVSGDYETMKSIHRYWVQESIRLKGRNYEFAHLGVNDGVLKVTIPSRVLFQQEDSVLSLQADGLLRPFLRLVRGDDALATLVITCHSDNNGSDRYLNDMTASRAHSLSEWFAKQGTNAVALSTYGIGKKVPRTDNSSMAARERNRRVTLYLVPNKKMLKLAKKGKL